MALFQENQRLQQQFLQTLNEWEQFSLDEQLRQVAQDGMHILMHGLPFEDFNRLIQEKQFNNVSWFSQYKNLKNVVTIEVRSDLHEIAAQALNESLLLSLRFDRDRVTPLKISGNTSFNTHEASLVAASCLYGFDPLISPQDIKEPTVVFEVAYSESRGHMLHKLDHWFKMPKVKHAICIWIRRSPYHHKTGGVSAGEVPVLVWHYQRTEEPPPSQAYQVAANISYPLDIGTSWQETSGPNQKVISIPSKDLFANEVPLGFPSMINIDLFLVHEALIEELRKIIENDNRLQAPA